MKIILWIVAAIVALPWFLFGRSFARKLWREHCDAVCIWAVEHGEPMPSERVASELEERGPTVTMWIQGLFYSAYLVWLFAVGPVAAVWMFGLAANSSGVVMWGLAVVYFTGWFSFLFEYVERLRQYRRKLFAGCREVFGALYDSADPAEKQRMESFVIRFGPLSPYQNRKKNSQAEGPAKD